MKIFIALFGLAIINGGLAIRKTLFTKAGIWCTHASARVVTGDFDGDGLTDVMCYDAGGTHWIRYAKVFRQDEHLPGLGGWCTHAGSKRHVGDFNGDGKDDLLCHDKLGNLWITIADHYGLMSGTTWHQALHWCTGENQLFVGDFNGDKRADLLCHSPTNGHKWVALSSESHYFHAGTSWEGAMGWCYHQGAQLLVGDFNGDPYADIMCHDNGGKKWIALGQQQLYYEGFKQVWQRDMGWCSHGGSELVLADLNGDGLCDMVCHDPSGATWTFLNQGDKYFEGAATPHFKFCLGNNNRFLAGNFVADRREELLCTATQVWFVMEDVVESDSQ